MGRREAFSELTFEGFLDTAATSYWTQILVAWKKCGWVFRMTLAPHLEAMVSWLTGGTGGSPAAWPKKGCPEHTLTSLWRRKGYNDTGKQGRAQHRNSISLTEEAMNILSRAQKILKETRDRYTAVHLLNLVLTFKTTEKDAGSGSLPWLLWEACYGGRTMAFYLPGPVNCLYRR